MHAGLNIQITGTTEISVKISLPELNKTSAGIENRIVIHDTQI